MFDYNGRAFRPGGEEPGGTQARYHQDGDLVWGEFAGGHVRRGSLTGTCSPDGVIVFAYSMVLDSGEVISGRCRSTPRLLEDGRIRLSEEWERYTPGYDSGVSCLEEILATDVSRAHTG
ncbi:MAG TPA: hypothetical protein VGS62_01940 [Streptosporangiaceae bacterium]|nr:hypothetical protein [Streptosporangiaceae bacterium]